MKLLASTLLLGAAAAAVAPQQHVLKAPKASHSKVMDLASPAWAKPLQSLTESLKSLSADARELWDEMALRFPQSFEQATGTFFSSPKPHIRRPDSHWDYVVKGADVQNVWVEGANGEKHREIDGKLEHYNLRAKKVDTSKLGIDPGVKQFSGYLDDEENDKHLFYCECLPLSRKDQADAN
jgi:cathepsin A (carboxypeptidase C)